MKKKIVTVLICSIMLSACGSTTAADDVVSVPASESIDEVVEEPEIVFDLDEYKQKALDLSNKIYDTSTTLVNIAVGEVKVLEEKKKLGGTEYKLEEHNYEFSCELYKTTPDDLDKANDEIRKLYKEFFLIENDGSKEAVQIEDSITTLYDNYSKINDIVTAYGASSSSIATTTKEAGNEIVSANDKIKLFCEE